MRVIVFFDLPMLSNEEKSEYRKFRKFLIKSGFLMMQNSVYVRLAFNNTHLEKLKRDVNENKPKSGLVQVLSVTEKQFQRMETIIGENKSTVVDSDERLLVL